MAGARTRYFAAVAIVAIAGLSLTACSKSSTSKTAKPNVTAPSQVAQGNGGGGSAAGGGAGASAAGGAGAASAAAGDNTLSPNSQAIKDVPLGDGGYELTTTAGADDVITFTKSQQLIQVHVSHGVPGAAMTLAQKVASKL